LILLLSSQARHQLTIIRCIGSSSPPLPPPHS
jgi:hypothetical protein